MTPCSVENAVNIEDLQTAAEKRAHAMVYGYLAGGADAERSLRRSVAAFNDVELRHAVRTSPLPCAHTLRSHRARGRPCTGQVLHGVGHGEVDVRTNVMGIDSKMPFFITSCAGQRMFHADGEVATAKAAKKRKLVGRGRTVSTHPHPTPVLSHFAIPGLRRWTCHGSLPTDDLHV